MRCWRFIDYEKQSPARNMAVDEAIFLRHRQAGFDATLRFYGWLVPTLSLGYGQDYENAVNEDLCRARGIAVVRRPTGGWAVLHNDELTYSIVSSVKSNAFHGCSSKEIYRRISEAFVLGLKMLGIEATQNKISPATKNLTRESIPCFQIPSYYEVMTPDGKKIIGSAQKYSREAFLQHGSVPITLDKQTLYEITRFNGSTSDFKFASLSELTRQPISRRKIADALRNAFEEIFRIKCAPMPLTKEETALAEKLEKEKYQNTEWTKRSV